MSNPTGRVGEARAMTGWRSNQPIVTQWDAESNILWSNEVPGRGHSSPVVVGDSVFLTTALEDQQKQLVLAYDRHTGDGSGRHWYTRGAFRAAAKCMPRAAMPMVQ